LPKQRDSANDLVAANDVAAHGAHIAANVNAALLPEVIVAGHADPSSSLRADTEPFPAIER
jgi:hypothetical protein